MRRPNRFDHNARRLAMMGVAVRSLAPVVRDALKDDRVRDAVGETYGTGRRIVAEMRGADPRDVAARMARDEDLQHELAAMVRSVARVLDEGMSGTRRRLRRRTALLVTATGGIIAVVVARRRTRIDGAPVAPVADHPDGAKHHAGPDHGAASRPLATPAARGLADR